MMDFRDYARAARRSIVLILVATLLGGLLGAAYLVVAPRKYDASAVLVIAANNPASISDAKTGADLAESSASTAAAIIDSPVVLAGAADDLDSRFTVTQLTQALGASSRSGTPIIDLSASASSPEDAADIVNAAAQRASGVLPALLGGVAASGNSTLRVDIVQPAVPQTVPTSPNRNGVLGIAVLIGLCVGVALAIIRYTLDTRVRERGDLRALDLGVIGEIPRSPRGEADLLPARDAPVGLAGEAYRNLRTNVLSFLPEESGSAVLAPVGSPHDISAMVGGLAWSMADARRSTVVVDLDVRNPGIDRVLRLGSGPGVTDVLSGTVELSRALRPTPNERLFALTAGSTAGRPEDILASAQLGQLLADLEGSFELVIVRAPALSMYTDAALVARWATVSVLVVRAGRDKADEVRAADNAITTAAQAPIGVVLDGVRPRGRRFRRADAPRRIDAGPGDATSADLLPAALDPDELLRPRAARRAGPDDGA